MGSSRSIFRKTKIKQQQQVSVLAGFRSNLVQHAPNPINDDRLLTLVYVLTFGPSFTFLAQDIISSCSKTSLHLAPTITPFLLPLHPPHQCSRSSFLESVFCFAARSCRLQCRYPSQSLIPPPADCGFAFGSACCWRSRKFISCWQAENLVTPFATLRAHGLRTRIYEQGGEWELVEFCKLCAQSSRLFDPRSCCLAPRGRRHHFDSASLNTASCCQTDQSHSC